MDKRIIIAALIHCIIISATFKAYGAAPEILMQTSRLEGFPVEFIVRAHCCPVKVPDDYYKV